VKGAFHGLVSRPRPVVALLQLGDMNGIVHPPRSIRDRSTDVLAVKGIPARGAQLAQRPRIDFVDVAQKVARRDRVELGPYLIRVLHIEHSIL
jgi:hypothetical protein